MRLHCCLSQQALSNVTIGLAYELLVLNVLRRYSFHLYHTGKTGDRGRDFIGHWVLPNRRVPVVGQCKHHRRPLRPGDVREFENVLHRRAAHHLTCTGLLVSHSGFSAKAVEMFQSSKVPMMLCRIKFKPHSSLLSLGSVGTGIGNHGNSAGEGELDHEGEEECPHEGERELHRDGEGDHHEGAPLRMETTSDIPATETEPAEMDPDPAETDPTETDPTDTDAGLDYSHHPNIDGILSEFALNSKAQKLVTNVEVLWRSDSSMVEGRGEVVLLCSAGGRLHNMRDDAEEFQAAALAHE